MRPSRPRGSSASLIVPALMAGFVCIHSHSSPQHSFEVTAAKNKREEVQDFKQRLAKAAAASQVLKPAMKPSWWQKIQPGIPVVEESSSSRRPLNFAGMSLREEKPEKGLEGSAAQRTFQSSSASGDTK